MRRSRAFMTAVLSALALGLIAVPVSVSAPVFAVEPNEQLADPALEARAREVSRQLRCVVCLSQSIDESNALLARDMRALVRERIVAGDTNEEAIDYIVQRYGEFVLLAPPAKGGGLLLWLAPLALFLGGGALAVFIVRGARGHSGGDAGDGAGS